MFFVFFMGRWCVFAMTFFCIFTGNTPCDTAQLSDSSPLTFFIQSGNFQFDLIHNPITLTLRSTLIPCH